MSDFEQIPTGKKLSHYILGNARTFIIAFILFTVIVVMTTDVRLVTISSITDLGLDFFLLLFASYGMYVCCADGGINAGYSTDVYKDSVEKFKGLKDKIEGSFLPRMNDFCNHYCDEELRKTRMQYLSVVCIPYDVYIEKYVHLGAKEINALPELKEGQKKAIKKANKVKRIKLSPERIMTLGKTIHTRSVLSITPDALRNIAFGKKILKMSFISICMSMIAFDIITQPSWTVFASVCLKLVTVIINGFDGHKEGFINITVHTVNYVNSQSSLMQQAVQYIEAHPTTTEE
jgi:hypothetical protein